MRKYDAAVNQRITKQAVRRQSHEITAGSHVGVPGLAALLVGLFVLIPLIRFFGLSGDTLLAAAMAGLVTFCVVLFAIFRWGGTVEEVLGFDLNGDGYKGDPPPQVHKTAFEARLQLPDRGVQTIYPEFDLDPAVVCKLFQSALADDRIRVKRGGIIPASEWTTGESPISRDDWDQFMGTLRRFELARFRNGHKTNGHVLTEKGRVVMEKWLSEYACSVSA